ncbi:MAG: glycosyltransferase family 9 protein [Deltaproteobacteria bacterium]|jgi:ADP-heptose:LPS heptosyltransferase|nr:glycosyltransferase family 9 protein [Deltaproteobacteria bacterium]
MNQEKPILILQMQRMGDLVLSYPLFGWLASALPGAPIWVVGERLFFEGLVDISPPATYFEYSAAKLLQSRSYSLLINLSHRREAALLAGSLASERRVGPRLGPEQAAALHLEGNWQLYRASIAQNNRHNLFHWADLNALDLIPLRQMRRTNWPLPEAQTKRGGQLGQSRRIGLFVGASEADKRPDPPFWASLAEKLLKLGFRPVFLGGKGDHELASRAADILKAPALNLCGKFSIKELCLFIKEMELLVVPDTGPMHIAAWLGVPVLNLSLGPVNAWETGPFAPNQYVMRRKLSCVGCWQCGQARVWCKENFSAERAAEVAALLLAGRHDALAGLSLPGYELYQTRRDENGLFDMRPTTANAPHLARSRFWKLFFLLGLKKLPRDAASLQKLAEAAQSLREPQGLEKMLRRHTGALLLQVGRSLRGQSNSLAGDDSWQNLPPLLRPLSSFIQMKLQNENSSRPALLESLALLELFENVVS